MANKKFRKIRQRHVQKVRDIIPDNVAERAMALNPLQTPEEPQVVENVPRITNETITEHREEVLKGARKYIYPLQHSKRKIVSITLSLAGITIVAFLIYCTAALYKFHQYNTFIYRVTQVVPFPVAKVDGNYVAYENYLFQLRHFLHYYETQQQQTFDSSNKDQLQSLRQQSLTSALNDAYIKVIAKSNGVSVSDKEVDSRLAEAREQNRLGSNNKVFADVLRDYWGWSVSDFKRVLKQEILAEKVSAKLDKTDTDRANAALAQLAKGADFGELAKQVSDDPSKAAGGDYGFSITKSNPNVPPEIVDTLFSLKPGQTSGIILASPVLAGQPPSLQIVKVNTNDGNTVTAQHIVINLKDPSYYVDQLKNQKPSKTYIKI
ncbi:MAG TPA: SurA N-terminal domain-containing protein [Candidatus Binatia bacterium]|nr:SurA N-terminal domain-containing protein [Candidatus Binatia bacterium]